MKTTNDNVVVAIFHEWNGLLGSNKWNLPIISEKTHGRWFDGGFPRGAEAKQVAEAVWTEIQSPKKGELRENIIAVVRQCAPTAPVDTWNKNSCGAWFYAMAESARHDRAVTVTQSFTSYLISVANDCSELVTRGIALGGDLQRPLRLAHVYAQLETDSLRPAESGAEKQPTESQAPLVALEVLFDPAVNRIALVGEPGSGKSTFLQYVTLGLADHVLGSKMATSHFAEVNVPEKVSQILHAQKLIPFRILLRDFAVSLNAGTSGGSADVVAFLTSQLEKGSHSEAVTALPNALDDGLAFVFFDGLDEVPKVQLSAVQSAITAFVTGKYENCRAALTCRIESYKLPEFKLEKFPPAHRIAPLSAGLRDQFVGAWYRELEHAHPQFRGEADGCTTTLRRALNSERLDAMSRNPFFLTVMAALHRPDRPLPDTGAKLMDELVTGVLEESRKRRSALGPKIGMGELATVLEKVPNGLHRLRSRLEIIAYQSRRMRTGGDNLGVDNTLIKSHLLTLAPATEEKDKWIDELLDILRHRAGLLQSQDGANLTFAYRFEEFLAGCYLTNDDQWPKELDFAHRCVKLVNDARTDDRQVVLWAAGFNTHVRFRRGTVRDLVSLLTPSPGALTGALLPRLELAADIARDANMEHWVHDDVPHAPITVSALRTALETVRDGVGKFNILARSRASSTLSRLGDFRPGVGLIREGVFKGLPDISWIAIPAGVFQMGGEAKWQGELEFTCRLLEKSPYLISRYPITVAQFQCFVDDQGYEDGRFWNWSAEVLQWRKCLPGLSPENYALDFQMLNHPRVGISWFEAVAFCHWLTEKVKCRSGQSQISASKEKETSVPLLPGNAVRLPSEAEWEHAMRGEKGRSYPWGEEKDFTERCNMIDTGIKHTAAVGLFPDGNTEKGIADAAGNVWEWCTTQWLGDYKDYPKKVKNDLEGHFPRICRGGSWSNSGPGSFLSSFRGANPPSYRGDDVGFRVVCAAD